MGRTGHSGHDHFTLMVLPEEEYGLYLYASTNTLNIGVDWERRGRPQHVAGVCVARVLIADWWDYTVLVRASPFLGKILTCAFFILGC